MAHEKHFARVDHVRLHPVEDGSRPLLVTLEELVQVLVLDAIVVRRPPDLQGGRKKSPG